MGGNCSGILNSGDQCSDLNNTLYWPQRRSKSKKKQQTNFVGGDEAGHRVQYNTCLMKVLKMCESFFVLNAHNITKDSIFNIYVLHNPLQHFF